MVTTPGIRKSYSSKAKFLSSFPSCLQMFTFHVAQFYRLHPCCHYLNIHQFAVQATTNAFCSSFKGSFFFSPTPLQLHPWCSSVIFPSHLLKIFHNCILLPLEFIPSHPSNTLHSTCPVQPCPKPATLLPAFSQDNFYHISVLLSPFTLSFELQPSPWLQIYM